MADSLLVQGQGDAHLYRISYKLLKAVQATSYIEGVSEPFRPTYGPKINSHHN